jgi:predicted DNA-binding transcriptional regulator YafY
MGRASDTQKAERLNRARVLLRQFDQLPDAVERLARDCSISPRQAYRYVQQAQRLRGPVPVSESKLNLAFTVKLPRSLIQRVRLYASVKRISISEVVARALLAFLPRGGGRG